MPDSAYLTIGKVVKRLQAQYPDLSVSKVRFLEDEGLLTPARTPGGYRLYSTKDVQRLEKILYLQKNRFLPLSVIKEELDRVPEPKETAASKAPQTPLLPEDDPAVVEKLHPIERIPELTGISVALVRQLAEVGAIKIRRSPHGRDLVDGHDFRLIRAADQLRRFGIGTKNLRQYVMAANRESGMIAQALAVYAKRASDDEGRRQFDDALDQILLLTDAIRDSMIRSIIAESAPKASE
ncbi:MAG: MerR family transcriptional regulator [Atopobiaceae bacterium]|nr:MerR family transcriptional regulator [Atopobiaceae bacterium]